MKKSIVIKLLLAMMVIFASHTSGIAQDIETKMTQRLTITDVNWNKVLNNGDPVTIFSYKQKDGIHSFGVYSDDYVGEFDMKTIPFSVDQNQLKKLPKNSKKKLAYYTEKACSKAREKALSGKYTLKSPDQLLSKDQGAYVRRLDPITIIGYRAEQSLSTRYYYYYAVLTEGGAGVCYNYDMDKIVMNNVPLPFLPSIDDPQVKATFVRHKQILKERYEAAAVARQAEQRRLAEEKAAQRKALEEQRMENLKLMNPAYIEVKGWNMDSAGGIAVNIAFTNCDRFHSIKYVYFQGYFLNAVGDKCKNSVNGSTVWKYTGVGPINPFPSKPGQYGKSYIANYCFDAPLFYAKTAHSFRLSSITIEYTNGKKKVLTGDELDVRVDYED